MSIRPAASNEPSKVQSPKAESHSGGWKILPHINQLHPRGADAAYVNGAYNCAPAIVAMLARGAGKKSELSDAQLITELGQGLVTREGTTPEGVAAMLGRVGLSIPGKALAGNYNDAAVKEHLEKGHKLIAQVALTDTEGKNASAHYVLVRDVNAQGNYVVSDPMASKTFVVTPEQLRDAVRRAPPDGGLLLPVSPKATSTSLSAAVALASARISSASSTARTASTKAPTDEFARSASAQKPERMPATSVTADPQAVPPPAQPLNAGTLARLLSSSSVRQFIANQAAPDPSAFSVADSVFEGVETQFSEIASTGMPLPMSAAERRNAEALGIDYGEKGAKRTLFGGIIQVSPRGMTAQEFVQELRRLKQNNDPKADKILERLESSRRLQDKRVLELYRKQELRDPGIGKKTWVDPM